MRQNRMKKYFTDDSDRGELRPNRAKAPFRHPRMWIGGMLLMGFMAGDVAHAASVRLKELVNVVGVRENNLVGYGLVVGLNGTGDTESVFFTSQSISSMLAPRCTTWIKTRQMARLRACLSWLCWVASRKSNVCHVEFSLLDFGWIHVCSSST